MTTFYRSQNKVDTFNEYRLTYVDKIDYLLLCCQLLSDQRSVNIDRKLKTEVRLNI